MITTRGEPIKCFIIQVPLQKQIQKLSICLLDTRQHNSSITIKEPYQNYFFVYNLKYDNQYYPDLFPNTMISIFLNFFFDKQLKTGNIFQESLVNYVIKRISCSQKIELKAETILMFFKYCLKFNLEPLNIQAINILQDNINNKNSLNPEFYLSNTDIQNLILNNQRSIFNNLIINIYAIYNKEYLLKLIYSKNGNLYSRTVFNLLNIS